MLHTKTDASKVAFATLVQQLNAWGYQLIDCQVHTRHLTNFGAEEIARHHFIELLDEYCDAAVLPAFWQAPVSA